MRGRSQKIGLGPLAHWLILPCCLYLALFLTVSAAEPISVTEPLPSASPSPSTTPQAPLQSLDSSPDPVQSDDTSEASPAPPQPQKREERPQQAEVSSDQEHGRAGDEEAAAGHSGQDQQTREQHQVAILKRINRVNEDGSYTFGYEAADGSFKIETRDVLGHVKGMYGYVDEHGQLKRVSYSAANGTGFQADSSAPERTTYQQNTAQAPTPAPSPGSVHPALRSLRPLIGSPVERSRPTPASGSLAPASVTPRRPVLILRRPVGVDVDAAGNTLTPRPEVIQQIPRRTRPDGSEIDGVIPVSTSTSPLPGSTPPAVPVVHFVPRKESVTTPGPAVTNSRRPVLVLATPRPQPDGSTPTPAPFGQFVRRNDSNPVKPKPILVLATPAPAIGQLPRRLLVTRRPYEIPTTEASAPAPSVDQVPVSEQEPDRDDRDDREGREGNDLRRQLSPDRDIDPVGLIPGVGQLVRLRQPGTTADSADVYGGSVAGLRPLQGTPHVLGILQQENRALQNQLLQKQILGNVDLTPRPRPPPDNLYNDYSQEQEYSQGGYPRQRGRVRGGRQRPLEKEPPVQLDPNIAKALEQFLLARGIRLRPVDPQQQYPQDPYVPAAGPVQYAAPYMRRPYAPRPYVPYMPVPVRYPYIPPQAPYYEDEYDPYEPYMRPYAAPYRRMVYYDQPYPQPYEQQAYLRPRPRPIYPEEGLSDEVRQELLLRMLLGARAQVLARTEGHHQQQNHHRQQQQQQQNQVQEYDNPSAASTTPIPTTTSRPHSSRVRNVKILEPENDSPNWNRPTREDRPEDTSKTSSSENS